MVPHPQPHCLRKPVPKPLEPRPLLGRSGPKLHEDPDVERAEPVYRQPVWRGGFLKLKASELLRHVLGALLQGCANRQIMGSVAWDGLDGVADAFEEGHVLALGRQQGHERCEGTGCELSVELEEGAV